MKELLVQVETLQDLLISQATGGRENNAEFTSLRQVILSNTAFDALVPQFISIFKVKTTSFSWLALAFKISL